MALKSLIRLGCLVQRLTVYTVATVNSHLPIALDNQPANLCTSLVGTILDDVLTELREDLPHKARPALEEKIKEGLFNLQSLKV